VDADKRYVSAVDITMQTKEAMTIAPRMGGMTPITSVKDATSGSISTYNTLAMRPVRNTST
jgi:hypothetical protein